MTTDRDPHSDGNDNPAERAANAAASLVGELSGGLRSLATSTHELTELARRHGTASVLDDQDQMLAIDQAHDDAATIADMLAQLRYS